ncbi:MAG: urease accessory protein UreE [Cyanobacteria bacterium P01_D01_bin.105]
MERVLAQTYLGNAREDEGLAKRVGQAIAAGLCLEVEIGRSDRTKGRILTRTASGQPVGLMKDRDWQLREGDVLETVQGHLVLVHVEAQPLMALRFSPNAHNHPTALVQLGHTLGNQHWPITVRGDVVYVEMVATQAQMEKVVNEMAIALKIKGLKVSFEAKPVEDAVEFLHHHAHTAHAH